MVLTSRPHCVTSLNETVTGRKYHYPLCLSSPSPLFLAALDLINWLVHVSRQQRERIRYAGIQLSKNKKGIFQPIHLFPHLKAKTQPFFKKIFLIFLYFICLPKKSPLILVKNHKKSEVTFLRLRYYLAVAMNQQR